MIRLVSCQKAHAVFNNDEKGEKKKKIMAEILAEKQLL